MKYCLNSRVSAKYLSQADEIKIAARDYRSTLDLLRKYTNQTIILEVAQDIKVDSPLWTEWANYNKLYDERFILCVKTIEQMNKAYQLGIYFYLSYSINDELDIVNLNKYLPYLCYIKLGGLLPFNSDVVKTISVPIRWNVCEPSTGLIQNEQVLLNPCLRPEDVELYENQNIVHCIEFTTAEPLQEETLFKIYKSKHWDGLLCNIIPYFVKYDTMNNLIPQEFGQTRLNCKGKCLYNKCHICDTLLRLSTYNFLIKYKDLNNEPIN